MARKLNKNLLALGSAAIVSVYAVGFARTAVTPASVAANAGGAGTTLVAGATQPPPADAATAIAQAIAAASATPAGTQALLTAAQPSTSFPATAAALAAQTATAAPSTTAAATATAAATSGYRDGTYTGTGTSRLGDVNVAVTVQGGQIAAVQITGGTTHYPLSRISQLPGEVVAAQSTTIKLVSGATYSSQAFKQAVTQALASARA